ncbi:isochorismatase family cysteine hydrolase [Terrilactibacillus tamarindi]|nr:isochorismatase family cysteine hydrolase [Terrilactibacillus tamarindi]
MKDEQLDQSVALLIIDMMNTMDFPEADLLIQELKYKLHNMVELKQRCKQEHIPVIYINDHYDLWKSDVHAIVSKAMKGKAKDMIKTLIPDDDNYFVFKPKHSGFFATPLESLLKHLGVGSLILMGVAGNICVLFTANDAYMRDYKLFVPQDCCASNVKEDNDYALKMMKNVLKANISPQNELNLKKIKKEAFNKKEQTLYEN